MEQLATTWPYATAAGCSNTLIHVGLQVTQFHCQVQAAVASSNKWNIIETTHHVKFHLTGLASFLALRVRELCVKKTCVWRKRGVASDEHLHPF